MLEKIFGSVARVKLLKVFLLNSDKKFYIRQLSRDLNLQVNSVRRELLNLEEFGLLQCNDNTKTSDLSSRLSPGDKDDDNNKGEIEEVTPAKNIREKKYYQVNKNFILFSELKSLLVKSQILAGESFIEKLKMICDPQFILLGGMFLNNEGAPTDVLVVADIDKDKVIKIVNDLEVELNREVNFTIMDEEEFSHRQEVADVFLHTVLNSKKIILVDKIFNNK